MLHTVHNYLSVQLHFHRTNPLIHINSRLQYANTKLASPYYMKYSYIIQPNYCEGTLCNFDPIKICFLFSPLYAETNRPILIPIEYIQCVEGEATKCMQGHTFNLLYRDWKADKLDNREPSKEETQIFNHLFALQPPCNVDLYSRAPAACLAREPEFLEFFETLTIEIRISSSNIERRPQSYITLWAINPTLLNDSLPSQTHSLCNFSYLFFSFSYGNFYRLYFFLLSHNWRLGSVLFLFLPVGTY